MIFKTEQIKDVCSKLLLALDSDSVSVITETLELITQGNALYLIVTNMEYIVKTRLSISNQEEFHATVSADTFLKLIHQITTDKIELVVEDNILIVKGNGIYKLPMIYNDGELMTLPNISINSITHELDVTTQNLMSILKYNSRELSRGTVAAPVQKLYYLDNEGCITFTTGACVTSFSLSENIEVLLNSKLVKLFKLFEKEVVHVKLGVDSVGPTEQVKISFFDDVVELTGITPTTKDLINLVPKKMIRDMATTNYPYEVSINAAVFKDCINRLLLFMPSSLYMQPFGQFEFVSDHVNIYDKSKNNVEIVYFLSPVNNLSETLLLDLNDVKSVLDSITEETIFFRFGNGQSVVIGQPNVYNIIPECIL